jgi:hypothetical protein
MATAASQRYVIVLLSVYKSFGTFLSLHQRYYDK